jgi:Ca2+-binding RTX toxin-like protein
MHHRPHLFLRLTVPALAAGAIAFPALSAAHADDPSSTDATTSATASASTSPTGSTSASPTGTASPSASATASATSTASASASASPTTLPPAGLLCNGVTPTLWATADGQTLTGTSGNDVIAANGFHNLTIDGGAGDDVICGSNVASGTSAGNTLAGGAGDDLLISSGGRERLIGGAGDDHLIGTIADDVDYSTDGYTALGPGITVSLTTGTVTGTRTGTDTLTGLDLARIFGTAGADTFIGNAGANWFDGGSGADRVTGGAGDDWLHAVAPTYLHGNRGNDTLAVGLGGSVAGGPGNDVIAASPNNEISGASPDSGAVTGYQLNGQQGDDTFRVNTLKTDASTWSTAGSARWHGTIIGGLGTDQISYAWLGDAAGLRSGSAGGSATWAHGALDFSGIEKITGTPGNDILNGGPGQDNLNGGPGDDLLRGRLGSDVLYGNRGADRLLAGPGSDRAVGGPGRDTCAGAEIARRCEG